MTKPADLRLLKASNEAKNEGVRFVLVMLTEDGILEVNGTPSIIRDNSRLIEDIKSSIVDTEQERQK